MEKQKIRVDKTDWWIYEEKGIRFPQPLCPIHHLRMYPVKYQMDNIYDSAEESNWLRCEDCKEFHNLPRKFREEKKYVINKIDAKVFKGMKVLNLDDESVPLTEEKLSSEDKKYFVTGLLTKSKVGLRLVIYAGERGRKEKTQIFVEPTIKRLAFDQKDLHPTDVFTKVEATFDDDSRSSLNKK
jgi:hypothetical protein